MKAFRLAISAFLFLVFLSISLPSFSLSVYQWEQCEDALGLDGLTKVCATRNVGTIQQCHRDPGDGVWRWQTQSVVQAKIESNKNFAGICLDGYDNNCNGQIDSADTADCVAPISILNSVEGDTASPFFDTDGANSKTVAQVVVSDESDNSKIRCKWYVSQSGYDAGTGTACNNPTADIVPRIDCDMIHGSTQGSKTGYVACVDENLNGQPYTDGVASRTTKKTDWIGDWFAPSVSFTKPPDPTNAPYDVEIAISDTYSGVDKGTIKIYVSNDNDNDPAGDTWIDKTSAWFAPIPGSCATVGQTCTLTHTVPAGDAEATDGYHKLKVEVTDNAGNVLTPPIYTYLISSCKIHSVSISPSASCTKSLNACSVTSMADKACESDDSFDISVQYKGMNCPTAAAGTTAFDVQVDAKSTDSACDIQASGGDMTGMKISCENPTAKAGVETCTGTWTLPSPVNPDCQQKVVNPTAACIKKTDGTEVTCKIGGLSGSSSMCKDDTDTSLVSLDIGSICTASLAITAAISATDGTYGLSSCNLNWGDGTITTKTCDAAVANNCADKFSAAEKQHTYATAGAKTATFSCTNLNTKTKTIPKSTTIDTSTPDIVGINGYKDNTKAVAISSGVFQNDNNPYFEWTAATSACGVNYYLTTDGNEPTTSSTAPASNNYANPSNFADGTTTVKVKPLNGAGMWGTTRSFDLKVDTDPPATVVRETSCVAPNWCGTTTIHLDCSDSLQITCSSTLYCTGPGCTPDTAYSGSIAISSPVTLRYASTDYTNGNTELTKTASLQIDTTPPNIPAVTVSGAVSGYIKTPDQISISWSAVADQTPDSGIIDYKYSIGEAPACTNVVGFTSNGLVTSKIVTGISLVEGKNYCAKVMAVNGAGLASVGTSSNVQLDLTGPAGINSLTVVRTSGNYISNTFTVYSAALTDAAGVKTNSCKYTVDGSTWGDADWNSASTRCEKIGVSCVDGVSKSIKMKVSDLLGSESTTVSSVTKICDATPPLLESFAPVTGTTQTSGSKDVSFSTTAKDIKSGLAKLEWTLYKNGAAISDLIQTTCEGAPEGGSQTCSVKVSDFKLGGVNINPTTLATGDRLFVRVRADDRIDPWSGTGDSGQWSIDENAPTISTITPIIATFGAEQSYSANVIAVIGKTISSCGLLVNGVNVDDMALAAGTSADGTWTGEYTINTPAVTFMRAHCIDNENSAGDGLDVQILLATETKTGVNVITQPPSFPAPIVSVEKLQNVNMTARYTIGGSSITGAKCWVSSSDFNDPSKGIVGISLNDLNNGYYTYSFSAPTITGNYNYAVSCSKQGYQTSVGSSSFIVLGCDGPVCIKVMPKETAEVLRLGETRTLNFLLKNRDDFTRTYSISLASVDPRVSVEIAPIQATLINGEEKTVTLGLTSLAITDQLIVQNIIVQNTDPLKSADVTTSSINISVALGSVPEIGPLEIGLIFVLAAFLLYGKTGLESGIKRK